MTTFDARRRRRTLVLANGALLAALILHGLDHALDPALRHTPSDVNLVGTIGFVGAGVSLVLAWIGIRAALVFSLLTGVANAVGFVAVHLLPHWSALSQPFGQVGAGALPWASLVLTIGVAAALAFVALRLPRCLADAPAVAEGIS